jgi:hypothetical protein
MAADRDSCMRAVRDVITRGRGLSDQNKLYNSGVWHVVISQCKIDRQLGAHVLRV